MKEASSPPLTGKTVVVVGGTSGRGLGAMRAALDAGALTVVAGRRALAERAALEAPEGQIRQALVDVNDEASVRGLFDGLGAIDHLFVTAARQGFPCAAAGND